MAPTPLEAFRAAQTAEYSTYVAIEPITIDGARAFNAGDPVPVSHVELGVVDERSVALVADVVEAAPADDPGDAAGITATADTKKKG